ncbi:cytosine permease [Clostridium sp. AM58-1XD]|uniref:cytosine permease n=1 Tax=Clostridium sp. AM58-1XD TaxID=2292307 RepID=UPI000E4F177E|nr:cytosine permease [Clostridium sp. AM58-1XD]RGY97793.1 hypothetical protein DXA13_13025 [Clostridium sp. AM58-1XD]
MAKTGTENGSGNIDGLSPITEQQKTMKPMDYVMTFWSSGIIIQIMVIGLYLMPPSGGLNFQQVVMVGIISALICTSCIAINGDAGMRYGIPFIIQARSGFGIQGAKIVALIRSIPAICWNGIGTWIGAQSIVVVTDQLFGISNIWVSFIAILIIESWLAYKGVDSIKSFNSIMSVVIFCMLFYFFYIVFSTGKVDISSAMKAEGSWSWPFVAGIFGAVANWTTVMLNSSDLTRHVKVNGGSGAISRVNAFMNSFGIIPPWMFMVLSGVIIAIATGADDPIAGLVTLSPNPAFGIILLVFIILAQVTSNLSLNILPPALAFQDIFKIDWKKGVFVVGILSVAVCPWILYSSNYFFVFQNVYSSFLGPALGVMVADYYVMRKRKLNLELLYDVKGVYTYWNGFSCAGMIALIISAAVSFFFLSYAWAVGFPLAFVLYIILKKCGLERRYEEQEREREREREIG